MSDWWAAFRLRYFCGAMGWHLTPYAQWFNGSSMYGQCPRCEKRVLQDSQGNWF